MTTENVENATIDLTKFSAQQLKDALAAQENAKSKERESYKELVAETVPKVFDEIMYASNLLCDLKGRIFGYFKDVLKLKATVFDVKEKQQSHTFSTDKHSITIGYRVTDGWDDTVSAGVQKVNDFIQSLAVDDQTAALVETVFNLLKKDAKGNLKANRVIELQQLTPKFNNINFTDGVKIILDGYKPVRSCWYIEASTLNQECKWESVPMAISSVDFPKDFEFDFFADSNPSTTV